jgi:hypothetical protein
MNDPTERPGSVTDRPPDPAAAAVSVREARRQLLASQGIAKAILGLAFFAAFAAVRLVFAYKTETYINTVILLVIAFIEAQVLLPLVAAHVRRRRGPTAVGRVEAQTQRFLSRNWVLALLAVLAVGGIALTSAALIALDRLHVSADWLAGFDTAVALAGTALLAGLFVARYRELGLWEDLLMVAAVTAAGLLFAFARGAVRAETFAMLIAAPAAIAGLSLHCRWKHWMSTGPKEADAPAAA